jgi:hypothetical protein
MHSVAPVLLANDPGEHCLQSVAPVLLAKSPALHCKQLGDPITGWYWPALHRTQALESPMLYFPSAQSDNVCKRPPSHQCCTFRLCMLNKRPASVLLDICFADKQDSFLRWLSWHAPAISLAM